MLVHTRTRVPVVGDGWMVGWLRSNYELLEWQRDSHAVLSPGSSSSHAYRTFVELRSQRHAKRPGIERQTWYELIKCVFV